MLTSLQIVFLLSAIVFIIISIRAFKRKKISLLTFMIFFLGSLTIGVFSLRVEWLNSIGITFWLERGADLIVYLCIILLFYFYFWLLNRIENDKHELTRLVSWSAVQKELHHSQKVIKNWENKWEMDSFILNIRAYNEWAALWKTLDEVIHYGFRKIIIINDGSQDNTLSIIEKKKAEYPECMILAFSHMINRGGGAANQTGYNFVKTYWELLQVSWFVSFDADGQMDIKDMWTFIDKIKHYPHIGLFLGSRFIPGAKTYDMPKIRKIILAISRLVTRIFYKVNISDPHNGYRVIRLDQLQKIALHADGMHYANEFNEQIAKNNIAFLEVPVNIRYTDYSLAKGQKNSNSIKLWLQMIYKKFFN